MGYVCALKKNALLISTNKSAGFLPPLIGFKTSLPSSVEHHWAKAIQHFYPMSCSFKNKSVYEYDLKLWLD